MSSRRKISFGLLLLVISVSGCTGGKRPPVPRVPILIAAGENEQLAWKFSAYGERGGLCLLFEAAGGHGTSCGPLLQPLIAHRIAEGHRVDNLTVVPVNFLTGVVDEGVVAIRIAFDNGRTMNIRTIHKPILRASFFVVHINCKDPASTITAFDAGGNEVATQKVGAEPSSGPSSEHRCR